MRTFQNASIALVLCLAVAGPALSYADQSISGLYRDSFSLESYGKIKAATNKVLMVLRKEPDSYFGNLRAGWLYYLQGNLEQSVRYYDRAVGLKPKAVESLLGKLLPLVGMASWGKVAETAQKALKLDSGNYTANSKLAYALYMGGNFAKALKHYQFMVERYPGDLEMKAGLAWTTLKMGRASGAKALFLEVLKINAAHTSSQSGLAACKVTL